MSGRNDDRRGAGTPSSRAARRRAEQEAAERRQRRRRYAIIGGAVGAAALVAVVLVALNLPGDSPDSSDIVVPTFPTSAVVTAPASTPSAGNPAGAADNPTTTVASDSASPTSGAGPQTPVATPTEARAAADASATALPGSGVVIGDPNATVLVIEWGDYQCPYCGLFARTYDQQLFQDYVNTGKIRFEFRDYPFLDNRVQGTESHDAAEAAHCADDQGKYWEYHETLYHNQGQQENNGAFAPDRLIEMARQLGLDVEQFTTCFDNDTYAEQVRQSAEDARAAGIKSTPTFSVNGTLIAGAKWEPLKQAIDAALANQ